MATGEDRSSGYSSNATLAKNASMSTWTMTRGPPSAPSAPFRTVKPAATVAWRPVAARVAARARSRATMRWALLRHEPMKCSLEELKKFRMKSGSFSDDRGAPPARCSGSWAAAGGAASAADAFGFGGDGGGSASGGPIGVVKRAAAAAAVPVRAPGAGALRSKRPAATGPAPAPAPPAPPPIFTTLPPPLPNSDRRRKAGKIKSCSGNRRPALTLEPTHRQTDRAR